MKKYDKHPLKYAFQIFTETGKRYKRKGPKKGQHLHKYFAYEANYKLIKTAAHSWFRYNCPTCNFDISLRASQGWPSHICPNDPNNKP